MTPKEMADWLDAAEFEHVQNGDEAAEVVAFLRSLPAPTTDARRKELAKEVRQGGHYLRALDYEEISALLLNPPRASRKAEIAEAMRKAWSLAEEHAEISTWDGWLHHAPRIDWERAAPKLETAIAAIPEDTAPACQSMAPFTPSVQCTDKPGHDGAHENGPARWTDPTDVEREDLARWAEKDWSGKENAENGRRAAALLRSGGTYEGRTAEQWENESRYWWQVTTRLCGEREGINAWLLYAQAECESLRDELFTTAYDTLREQTRAEKAEAERDALQKHVVEFAHAHHQAKAERDALQTLAANRLESIMGLVAHNLRAALNAPSARVEVTPVKDGYLGFDEIRVNGQVITTMQSGFARGAADRLRAALAGPTPTRLDPDGTAKPKCAGCSGPGGERCTRAPDHKGLHRSGDRRWNNDGVEYERVGWVIKSPPSSYWGTSLTHPWTFKQEATVYKTRRKARDGDCWALNTHAHLVARYRPKK